jgi:subtilisin family serine protease
MRSAILRRSARTALAAIAVAVVATGTTTAAVAEPDPARLAQKSPELTRESGPVKGAASGDRLGQRDHQLLEKARDRGARRVTAMIAAERGKTRDVAASVTAQGGTVVNRNDKVGYLRVSLPTARVEKVAGAAKVLAVDLDESIPLPDPSLEAGAGRATARSAAAAAPTKDTPVNNPYLPINETGSVKFRTANPAWDGRGTTIGILDSGVDLDHPALQKTTTGERKIVDWVTSTDPIADGDATWRAMLTGVTGPTFSYLGTTWTAPAGSYQVNAFRESITAASEPAGDVNRDGDTTDVFAVIYNPVSHDIWVDADQDTTFETTEKMRPYRENYDIGYFGTDDSATQIVERMPFVVEYREDVDLAPIGNPQLPATADFVNIGIVEDAHGSHVAGIAAANGMFGGAMTGQAPGAKLVSSRACTWGGGCTAAALTDGMVDLVANRGVDVVNMSIGGLPPLNDANNARARLYDALIDVYGVQLFISAGNEGPGVNTIGDPSVATDVVSVGAAISKATWKANYGSDVSRGNALINFSSRGPREDGGFKPNVMAPGSAISTVPRWLKQADVVEAGYPLPYGYAMFNGTSMSSPQAAGAAALLLSAGVATGTAITPRQLRESLYTSADWNRGLEAVSQGNGQVDVPGAWALLNKRPVTTTYTTKAPVCSPLDGILATPGEGTGLYNRCARSAGGQVVGQRTTYTVKVARTSGGRASTHRLTLIGDDGTFTVHSSVIIGGSERSIRVVSKARTPGLHSAILQIDDPRTPLVDHRVMLAVIAAEDVPEPSFSRSWSGSTERNLYQRHFITVPPGAGALQVSLAGIATKSQVRWIAVDPSGIPVEDTSTRRCYTNFSDRADCNPTSRVYADPIPGVWELYVESRRTSPFLANPFRLTAVVQGVEVTPPTQTVAAPVGTATPVTWTVENAFGPIAITPAGGSLGSALADRTTIADGASETFTVEVPAGAQRLDAVIGSPADAQADLDLSVRNAAGVVVGQSADGDSEESVSIVNPPAGTYTVVVDGYSVPAGTTAYDYRDVFFAPALGTLTVPGTAVTLDNGESAEVTGSLTAQGTVAAGRQLFGEMRVLSPANAVLGTGSVLVTP